MSRNRNSIPYIFLGHARVEGRARDLREHDDRGDSQSEMENVEERRRRPHREVGREGEVAKSPVGGKENRRAR